MRTIASAAAFCPIQPFACLDDVTRREAAHASLERTRTGGDGPLIEPASFVAMENDELLGAILVTLLPEGDPCDINSYEWREPPPADCIARRLGRPHLTWIFVSPFRQGFGTGSGLLDAAVRALLDLGYKDLLSTFMLGNDSSTLWHWRNGFRLLAYPASHRLLQERWRERIKEPRTK